MADLTVETDSIIERHCSLQNTPCPSDVMATHMIQRSYVIVTNTYAACMYTQQFLSLTRSYYGSQANFQHIHSRADVMKSYLDPFPKPTPYSNPNNPANPNSSRVPFNPPGMTSTPPNQTFDKQYQAGFCTAQPPFAANSPEPVNSWLEHCKLGSKQVQGTSAPAPGHSQGTSKPAPAALAPPAGLVEVRPNVWLPSSAIREAQGDFALAVQIAAQGSNLTSSDIPTDNSYFNMGGLSAGAQFNMKQAQPDGPLLDNPHASIKASYTQDDSKMQFMAGNATSYTPRSNTVSPVSAPVATDAVIEQYAMHNPASKYMTDLQQQHNQQQRNSGGSAASAYCFMSPIVGMPYVDPSNSFISPQCVLDTNSLFSYGLGIGGDTSHQPSNAGWYAKSTSPLYHTTATSGLSSIPHSSSGGVSGNAFSNGCSDNGWPAHASYWQSSANFFPDVQAPERIPSAPMKQHISSETAPMYNAWSASAANEPRHNYNQTSEESNHACTANQQPGTSHPTSLHCACQHLLRLLLVLFGSAKVGCRKASACTTADAVLHPLPKGVGL